MTSAGGLRTLLVFGELAVHNDGNPVWLAEEEKRVLVIGGDFHVVSTNTWDW